MLSLVTLLHNFLLCVCRIPLITHETIYYNKFCVIHSLKLKNINVKNRGASIMPE